MNKCMMNFLFPAFFIMNAGFLAADTGKHNWPMCSHDISGTHYQPSEKSISTKTVKNLTLKWFKGNHSPVGTPIIYNDKVYFGDQEGFLHAVQCSDGADIWSAAQGLGGIQRCLLAKGEYLYSSSITGTSSKEETLITHLMSIKRKNGKKVWSSYTEGGETIPKLECTPIAIDDMILIGTNSLEDRDVKSSYQFRGGLYAFDAELGFLKWRFLFTKNDDRQGPGVPSGNGLAVDKDLGYVYVGTGCTYDGSPSPYSCSLLCLNYRTENREGELIWCESLTKEKLWSAKNQTEMVIGVESCPLLFGSSGKKFVGIADKSGHFSAFKRSDGQRAWSVSLIPPNSMPAAVGSPGSACDGDAIYAHANYDPNRVLTSDIFLKSKTNADQNKVLKALAQDYKCTVTALKTNGKILWQRTFEGAILAPVSTANNVVFASFFSGHLRALDAKTGNTLLEIATAPVLVNLDTSMMTLNIPLTTTPVVSDGQIFIGGGFRCPLATAVEIPGGLFAFELKEK